MDISEKCDEDAHVEAANSLPDARHLELPQERLVGESTEEHIIRQLETAGEDIGFTWRTLLGCIVSLSLVF